MQQIKLLLIVFILGGTSCFSQNIVWNTMGNGLPVNARGEAVKSFADTNFLYVAYVDSTNFPVNNILSVQIWNGATWTPLPSFSIIPPGGPFSFEVRGIAAYKSKIYVAVSSIDSNTTEEGIYVYDNTGWNKLLPAFSGDIDVMEVLNGELFVAGDFTYNGGPFLEDAFTYDGNNFTNLPAFPPLYDEAYDAEFFNNEYYVTVGDTNSVRIDTTNVLQLVGGNWVSPVSTVSGITILPGQLSSSSLVFSYNNNIYFTLNRSLFLISNNDTAYYGGDIAYDNRDWLEYNGEIYLFGDSSLLAPRLYRFDGASITNIVNPPTVYTASVFNNQICTFSYFNAPYNGVNYNRAFRTQANFAILEGITYYDSNMDCSPDFTEPLMRDVLISLDSLEGNTISNLVGHYSFGLSPGPYYYDTVFIPKSIAKNVISNCNLPSPINIVNGQVITQDIGLYNPVPIDGQTYMSAFIGNRARQGFTEKYKVDIGNPGNTTLNNVVVNVAVPPSLSNVSSIPSPSSISGNTYIYNFLNLQPLEEKSIIFQAKVDTATNNIGDILTWVSYLDPVNGDMDLRDNGDTIKLKVVAAYDPNDKQASASQILPGTKQVDYHIRFQNLGNDTAYKVTVVDTLDLSLPITKVVINSASHPYRLSVVNNVLIWEFDSILLPHSNVDFLGSQGYLNFSAGLDPSLGIGDTIVNEAQIYFDYQTPVYTNKAKTVIVAGFSIKEHQKENLLEVFPNPSSTYINLNWKGKKAIEVELISNSGQKVDKFILRPEEIKIYHLDRLVKGIYYLRSQQSTYKLIVQ